MAITRWIRSLSSFDSHYKKIKNETLYVILKNVIILTAAVCETTEKC